MKKQQIHQMKTRRNGKQLNKHFKILKQQQKEMEYHFDFLIPEDYDYFFDSIGKNKFQITSKLDADLEKNGIGK